MAYLVAHWFIDSHPYGEAVVTDPIEICKVGKLFESREARLARIQNVINTKQEQFENYWRL